MSEKMQGPSSESRTQRANAARPFVQQLLAESTLRRLSEESKVSRSVLHEFAELGRTPQEDNLHQIERWLRGKGVDLGAEEQRGIAASYNEDREEAELARAGALPEPLLRIMERESIAAVIRAQGMRDACRAARLEAEKAVNRGEWARPPARRITPMEPTKPRRPGEEGREAS